MRKELQDSVWNSLPEEFKQEVIGIYYRHVARKSITSQEQVLIQIFGKQNLSPVMDAIENNDCSIAQTLSECMNNSVKK